MSHMMNNKVITIANNNIMENKYQEGEIVCAKTDPTLKLIIRRYVKRIYYCKVQQNPDQKELVYFERELMGAPEMANKN